MCGDDDLTCATDHAQNLHHRSVDSAVGHGILGLVDDARRHPALIAASLPGMDPERARHAMARTGAALARRQDGHRSPGTATGRLPHRSPAAEEPRAATAQDGARGGADTPRRSAGGVEQWSNRVCSATVANRRDMSPMCRPRPAAAASDTHAACRVQLPVDRDEPRQPRRAGTEGPATPGTITGSRTSCRPT